MNVLTWFLPRMSSHMLMKDTFTDEGFLTMTGLVWFLTCMNHHMLVQRILSCKIFLTLPTLICCFPQYDWSYAGQVYS